jgi:hypothetical protein
MKIEVSEREFYTIWAALWQRAYLLGNVRGARSIHTFRGLANRFGTLEPLTESEIEALCERLSQGRP